MPQVLFLHWTLYQAMAFKTLYCIFGKVLVIIDVINVKHYVDNINRKHNVAMATSPPPPPVNMADTLHILNNISRGRK